MRVAQKAGRRGSQKWIQRDVNGVARSVLDEAILSRLGGATQIEWLSPLVDDDFAEYRDAAFLDRISAGELKPSLAEFWPSRGPQWDALARSDAGDILLVEAKAHIAEMCSPETQAGAESRKRIEHALSEVCTSLAVVPRAPWTKLFYQLANRLAHLHFLESHGKTAWLVLVNYIGDAEMKGPNIAAEWEAAYQVAWHVMGIPKENTLFRRIIHLYPTAN